MWSQNAEVCAEAFLKAAETFDLDCIVTLIDLSVECDAWGQKIVYPDDEAAHPDYSQCVVTDIDGYASIKKADYRDSQRMMMHIDVGRRLVDELNGKKPVVAFVFGPLGVLSMLRSQQELFLDLYDDIDAVKAAAREINETLKEYVSALIKTGVSALMLDTLYASGSIMSKEMWDEAEGVLVEELADHIRAEGGVVMLHNCGKRIYFDTQIKRMRPTAISFLYPPDDCADFAECKEKYGREVTLNGESLGVFDLPSSGGFGDSSTAWLSYTLERNNGKLVFPLKAGQAKLKIRNADGTSLNLDYIQLIPAN